MKLDQIFEEWRVDSVIDETDLGNAGLAAQSLHYKYHSYLSRNRLILHEKKVSLELLKKEKFEFYVQGPTEETNAKGWKSPPCGRIPKMDAQRYVDNDDEVIRRTLKIGEIEERVSLLNSILKTLSERSHVVRNKIEWTKYTSGAY